MSNQANIYHVILHHKDGTKFYESIHVTLDNKSAIIRRWGKIGATGSTKTLFHPDAHPGADLHANNRFLEGKIRRGYDIHRGAIHFGSYVDKDKLLSHDSIVKCRLIGKIFYAIVSSWVGDPTETPVQVASPMKPKSTDHTSSDPLWGMW